MVKSTFDLIRSMCNVGLASSPGVNGVMPTGPGQGSDFCTNRTGLVTPCQFPSKGAARSLLTQQFPGFSTINPGENERTRALPGVVSQPRVARQEQPSKGKVQSYFLSLNISCGRDPALLGHYPQVTDRITRNSPCLPTPRANIKLEGKIQFPEPSERLWYKPATERAPK